MQMYGLRDLRYPARHGWPFVYFHGAIESLVGGPHSDGTVLHPPDLVAADLARDEVVDGIRHMDPRINPWA